MRFDIITIFPEIFDSYFKESILKRAQDKKLIKIGIHNLRDFTSGRHKTVDDKPYGGGIGMVIKIEPIYKAVQFIKSQKVRKSESQKVKVILFTPRGKKFNQQMAYKFSKLDQLIMICGRYEGVDERVAKYIADEEISIGDYVLMGGEIPAMAAIETVSRLIRGVLGKPELLKQRISKDKKFVEYEDYTRPPKFLPSPAPNFSKIWAGKKFWRARPKVWRVPKVLLSGDHKKIEEWRKKHGKSI